MINYRKYYWLYSLIQIVIAIVIAWQFHFYNNAGELMGLIGIVLTTIALLIAILEIAMLRNITEAAQFAVNLALGRITEIMSVSDISKGIKTAYDIQKYLRSSEYVMAHIRMQDLKFIAIPLKNDKRFHALDASIKLPDILSKLSIDINNLDSVITGTKNKSIDIIKMNGNLEDLVSTLIEYENFIKTN
jgi:hypothetical protein